MGTQDRSSAVCIGPYLGNETATMKITREEQQAIITVLGLGETFAHGNMMAS